MYIYTAENIHKIDEKAEEQGFCLFALMENAGRNIAEALKTKIEKQDDILILAGRGNNGGDGIVIARYLQEAGYRVSLHFPFGTPKTDTAKEHLAFYSHYFTVSKELYSEGEYTVIIDAMLGVGSKLPLRENVRDVIHWANKQAASRYAVDLPTGVLADNGTVGMCHSDSDVFRADMTFALHGAKPSAFLLPSSAFYGELVPISIGLKQESNMKLTDKNSVKDTFHKRKKSAHKGTFGTSLLLAGSDDMPGSALLAGIGAIRSGTGRLIIGTSELAASVIATRVPEATYMLGGIKTLNETGNLPSKISAIGIGPGLQEVTEVDQALDTLMQTDMPLVVDAGALLANRAWKRKAPTILTPHPGEFSRLTGIAIPDIQANRMKVAQDFAIEQDVTLVLKGRHTVIAFPDGQVSINTTGNTGLAKGGSGDVLTGMITSMLSYYDDYRAAVTNAVFLHGLCADVWLEANSETTMVASDFDELLPKVFRMMQ
ncbi:MAG TPA: NAD(P)H-hydrate dehydratase [Bacillota bacterium]|nr:NAD(P)H-hydrate dehydratase [Bacillota bacterium]